MKIIVVGLGETGRSLIKLLEGSGHDITVIDKDGALVDLITDKYSVNGVCGSGASTQTLKQAGAQSADVLVALTHTDEINLVTCMQAKSLGTSKCAARILQPDLADETELLKEEYNIDYLISPKEALASEIYRNIGLPGFVKLESCLDGEMYMIDLNAVGSSPLIGKTVADILNGSDSDMMIAVINRGKKAIVPNENDVIMENDGLYIVVSKENLDGALISLGAKKKKVDHVVIVGGGITGACLAGMLTRDKKKITILDDDLERCRELMERFPGARVAYVEGDITEVLEEEKVDRSDSIISLTDNDETNLVISMFAWSKGIRSVITRVDRQVHVKLLHKVNIDITVSPTELCVFRVMRFINRLQSDSSDTDAQIMEFINDLRKF
ncbi:MAG: Trk system potassium transporter TrkA [Lachnospiraceae bacterium]|nr:Trk system potassium transporter TrkA [Lachnospiraceae bacterium]